MSGKQRMKNVGESQKLALLSGDEALAQGAYEAGVEFVASYPGTPATEIAEYLACFKEVDCQWSVNEKVAFEVALAASIAGRRALFSAKHVGFNVAMDPLMTSAYTGVNAGFVAVSCDDPGLHSSQNEQDNRFLARIAKVPLLEPASPGEAKDFVKTAFAISESFDTPVMVRLTTRVSHTKEDVAIGERAPCGRKAFRTDIEKYVMVPRNAALRHTELEKRLQRLQAYSNRSALNRIEMGKKSLGLVTSGVSYLYAKEMFPDASFLKVGLGFPFPAAKARAFARGVKEILVIEELEPFLEEQLCLLGIRCRGKHPSFRTGELRPEYLPAIVAAKKKSASATTARRPVMCPGCPHRLVFAALKKLKLVVTGDIGCYTLGASKPLNTLHTCLCMGSGITFFEGFKRSLTQDVVGVIGDSTFVHSGVPGLINLAYNRTKGVVLILDNGTTAMTGNQPHPATGITIKGEPTKRLDLEKLCRACGADSVDVIDPHQVQPFIELVRRRLDEDALSVIIARAPCRLLERERRDCAVYQQEKCRKCYLCLDIDCPAIRKRADGYIEIDASCCSGCNLCVAICPAQAIIKHA